MVAAPGGGQSEEGRGEGSGSYGDGCVDGPGFIPTLAVGEDFEEGGIPQYHVPDREYSRSLRDYVMTLEREGGLLDDDVEGYRRVPLRKETRLLEDEEDDEEEDENEQGEYEERSPPFMCTLRAETNASTHQIPVFIFDGSLHISLDPAAHYPTNADASAERSTAASGNLGRGTRGVGGWGAPIRRGRGREWPPPIGAGARTASPTAEVAGLPVDARYVGSSPTLQ